MAIPVSVPLTTAERFLLLQQRWAVQGQATPVADAAQASQAARVRARLAELDRHDRIYGERPRRRVQAQAAAPPTAAGLHESGHAVAALALGVGVTAAYTRRSGRGHGGGFVDIGRCAPAALAVVYVAGAAAEFHGTAAPERVRQLMSKSDTKGLTAAAWQSRREGAAGPWARGRFAAANSLLRRHWPAVLAVAAELDRHGKLPGDVIHRIFEAHKGK